MYVHSCYDNAPINIFPQLAILSSGTGTQWGYSGGYDSISLPHPGSFDLLLVFDVKSPMNIVGDLIFTVGYLTKLMPHHVAFDDMVCHILTIALPVPEG